MASKNPPGGGMKLFKWLTKGTPPEDLEEALEDGETIDFEQMAPVDWTLESNGIMKLKEKLTAHGKTLNEYVAGKLFSGIKTGLTDIFIIDEAAKDRLVNEDQKCKELLKPFLRGQDLKHWHHDFCDLYLIALKSSDDYAWPWSEAGDGAEKIFSITYPSIFNYLKLSEEKLKKRQDKIRFWWELRCCDYWGAFEQKKIVWPDISKLPRFSMDTEKRYLGDTCFTIPGGDYYLLGILSSWASWFFISKTAQPLRLRGGRWQYRLKHQFMEQLPIPAAGAETRKNIAALARRCNELGGIIYRKQEHVRRRLDQTFSAVAPKPALGKLNTRAAAWWEAPFMELGEALAASFGLKANPFRNPRAADEWEPYYKENRAEIERLSRELTDTEGELNGRVYALFGLTAEEIKILEKEVEH